MADNKYVVGYAKLGTSSCKKCKQKIDKGGLRVGKVTPNPFSDDGGDMKQWFHPKCIFETFVKARATTKKIEEPEDAEGFGDLNQEDKDLIKQLIEDYQTQAGSKPPPKPKKMVQRTLTGTSPVKTTPKKESSAASSNGSIKSSDSGPSTSHSPAKKVTTPPAADDPFAEKDNSFREFRRLCADIAEETSYLGKTKLVNTYITKGHSGDGFRGDLYLLIKLLLPGVVKTVYNLNNKQLVKLFSQIFGTNLQRMVADLDQGDVAETIRWAFDESKVLKPQKKSDLSLKEVDAYLDELSQMSKEEDQQKVLTKVAKRCTSNDLKMFVRLIKHDLRINSGAKHILDGLDPNAYAAFQASRNLRDVVERVTESSADARPGMSKKLSVRAALLTPVLPMLAEACRSVEQAMKKCPNGFYAEIKYDGERVQVHKRGDQFKFFSRSLKPVLEHKIKLFRDFIPKAFATSNDLILDAEVLLVDTKTGNPLPFGTLGVHKKAAFQDATVCLFVFDCLLLNDENLMNKPIKERRQILEKNMTVVKNRVNLSEVKLIKKPDDLQDLMARVFREGLEGLVLKDVNGIYEPGKRHWLKVKKDYLHEGSMADAADLVVLGAYYGTGNKGGMMSIFLMGVYDPAHERWVTVSKCGSGLDDKKLESLNKELDVVKISKDFSKVPSWLHINKPLTPDFVVADPKKAPVWEIIGAEFSQAEIHTADGISIRFPRIQKFRDDKTWKEATDLPRLKLLFKQSKEKSDLNLMRALGKDGGGNDNDNEEGGDDTDIDSDEANETGTSSADGEMKSLQESRKRAASGYSEEEESPRKKVKAKPLCNYGADCYQKNPQHLRDFDHQPKTPTQKKISTSPSQPAAKPADVSSTQPKKLPSVFHGCKIVLPTSVEKYKELKRYILAFDGDLLHEFDASSATHIISDPSKPAAPSSSKAAQVNPDWLWTCIRKKDLVSTDPYRLSSSGS
ncbi:hypothetical protein BsWGS_26312 [Bradybaena similaris]